MMQEIMVESFFIQNNVENSPLSESNFELVGLLEINQTVSLDF